MDTSKAFTCPRCGGHKLEEVMIEVVQTTVITAVECVENGLACDYGDCSHDGGEVSCYQCGNCGNVVAENEAALRELLFPGSEE